MKMKCPFCGVNGTVSDSLLGRKVRCPKCKEIFKVTVATVTPYATEKEPQKDPVIEASGHVTDTGPAPGMTAKDEAALEEEIAKIFDDMKKTATDHGPDPWQDTQTLDKDAAAPDTTAKSEIKDSSGTDIGSISEEDLKSELENILGENCSMCGTQVGKATKYNLDGKIFCSACLPEGGGGESSSSKDLAVSGSNLKKTLPSDWEAKGAIIGAIGIIAVILLVAIYIILK
jgi:hypothetical protein